MKPTVSTELRQRVLELRHRHTQQETAEMTGLPLGTVKTLCSRSGAFHNNPAHRALFCLPPLRPPARILVCVPASLRPAPPRVSMPPSVRFTGDTEVDAVLWRYTVIDTGRAAQIEKVLATTRWIRTPLKELEQRYLRFLESANPENPRVGRFDRSAFADVEVLVQKAKERETLRSEAVARFGKAIEDDIVDTESEVFCISTLAGLAGLTRNGLASDFDREAAAARFRAHPEQMPNTLSDCLYELDYWHSLYRLRHAVNRTCCDHDGEVQARVQFVFGLLAERRPSSKSEAADVIHYLAEIKCMDKPEAKDILLNLISTM